MIARKYSDFIKTNLRVTSLLGVWLLLNGCCSRPAKVTLQPQPTEADSLAAAEAHLKQGKTEIAEQELLSLVRANPGNNEAYYYLNVIHERRYQERKREQEAESETNGLWYPTLPPKPGPLRRQK
jgi:hypothetical protein